MSLQMQGELGETRGRVTDMQGQLGEVSGRMDDLQGQAQRNSQLSLQIQGEVSETRGRTVSLEAQAEKLQAGVTQCNLDAAQCKDDIRQLAARTAIEVSCALQKYANDVITRVNHALTNRCFGFGPKVAALIEPAGPALEFHKDVGEVGFHKVVADAE